MLLWRSPHRLLVKLALRARVYSSARRQRVAVIHIVRSRAAQQQIAEMLEALGTYIKVAVDVQRGLLAGGGVMHADCEAALLQDGSRQEDVWGADWDPAGGTVTFEALINIRPRQGNPAMEILDPGIRERVVRTIRALLGET